jgi:ABC-type transport system substrate-binding protein
MTGAPHRSTKLVVRLAGLLSLALLAAAVAGLSAAREDAPAPKADQPGGRPPEQEDPDARPVTHHVTVDEPDENARPAAAPRTVDFAAAARDAKQLAVRNLFHELAVPHDFLKLDQAHHSEQMNIAPLPDYVGDKPDRIAAASIEVTPFDASWKPEKPKKIAKNSISSITPYEEHALLAVDDFLKQNFEKPADPRDLLSRYDQNVVAGQALTTVLLRLQSERQTGGRKGDAWQPLEDALQRRLFDVLLDELNAQVRAGKWDEAFDLTKRLATSYHAPKDQERIAQPLSDLAQKVLATPFDEKGQAEARRTLRRLQELFPDNRVVQTAADQLRTQAQHLLDAAREEPNKDVKARLLNEAKEAWPTLPELHAYILQQSNEHPTLRVGVRELPSRWSPGLAASDSDLRAVELLFESLVKLGPDGTGGGRWQSCLAEGRPIMIERGRQFRLPPNAFWSNGDRITARDVADTLQLMREGKLPRRPPVWAGLFDNFNDVGDPFRVKLTLSQGWLDPLALMNFKVLRTGSEPDSPDFLQNVVNSGPYVFAKNVRSDNDRTCVAFTANPYYGARPGKNGLPRIEEIHFIPYSFKDRDADPKNDHKEELAALLSPNNPGRLDVLLDLTAREAAALKAKASDLHIHLTEPSAPNRRIYFLAVNNQRTFLDKPDFRRALAYAIDREALLNNCFRDKPGQALHTPLNGPYPVHSWAADPKLAEKPDGKKTLDPFDLTAAKAELHKSGVQDAAFDLLYPAGDPQAEAAMKGLAEQVKAIGVKLTPTPLPPDQLRDRVEKKHDYYLAYYHYDFPDDVYWLGPLLDSGPGKANYLEYKGGGTGDLIPMIRDASRQRDFPQVRDLAHRLHDTFLKEEMPFIPLWQLDPQAAYHRDVLPPGSDPPFDPVLVFTDAELWKLNRK